MEHTRFCLEIGSRETLNQTVSKENENFLHKHTMSLPDKNPYQNLSKHFKGNKVMECNTFIFRRMQG